MRARREEHDARVAQLRTERVFAGCHRVKGGAALPITDLNFFCDNPRSMNKRLVVFLIAFCAFIPSAAHGEDTIYVLAANFSADGKVLELDIPPDLDGMRFFFAFQNRSSEPHVEIVVARAGRHSYETRHLPGWAGPMKYLAINLKGVQGRVKQPGLTDEMDMFLEPDQLTPSMINILLQHRIFGWSWTMVLFVVFGASVVFFRLYRKKSAAAALVLGFVFTWALMDLRIIADHVAIVYTEETFRRGLPPFTAVVPFANQAAAIIDGKPWVLGQAEAANFLKYRLAEHPYAPAGSGRVPAFSITENASDGPVVLQQEKYYVIKKEQR